MADPRREELARKVTALVTGRFGGDYRRAFNRYADAGLMGEDEVYDLLRDAEIGNRWTRPAWVRGVLKEVDADGDGKITWDEFLKVTSGGGP